MNNRLIATQIFQQKMLKEMITEETWQDQRNDKEKKLSDEEMAKRYTVQMQGPGILHWLIQLKLDSGFYGSRTHDLCNTCNGAVLYQPS